MATLGGALALGFHELGAIEPGRRAALAYAPADAAPADPETFLLSGEAQLERAFVGNDASTDAGSGAASA
jgi:cytosine/adenosine deaminase-related metal-dependent hydrolase